MQNFLELHTLRQLCHLFKVLFRNVKRLARKIRYIFLYQLARVYVFLLDCAFDRRPKWADA